MQDSYLRSMVSSFIYPLAFTLEGTEDVLDILGFPALKFLIIPTCFFIPAYPGNAFGTGLSPQDHGNSAGKDNKKPPGAGAAKEGGNPAISRRYQWGYTRFKYSI